MHGDGGDVIIGIIDVGGFDFAHPDFLDGNGKTRFPRSGIRRQVHAAPSRFEFGSEITDSTWMRRSPRRRGRAVCRRPA